MISAERRRVILLMVNRDGAASLRALADAVDSSEVTVRRDLKRLHDEGLLSRTRGGAVAVQEFHREPSFLEKTRVAEAEKRAIAARAASLVSDGDAVLIGAGTTTMALARELQRRKGLSVVTNSLLVAQILAEGTGVEVTMTGGLLRSSTLALVGSAAEQSLATIHAGRLFLSGNGLSADRGLSTPNATVASMDRALAAAAPEVVVLADHTKVGVNALVQTVPPAGIARVITDARVSREQIAALQQAGIDVDVVDP